MLDSMFTQEGWLFSVPALAGTAVFLVKIGLMTVAGIGADTDLHVDVHTDVDTGLGGDLDTDSDVHDSTHAFSLLSVQSIAALLMGFGWGGLVAHYAIGWELLPSVVAGGAVGALMVWLLGLMMKAVYDLASSGNIQLSDTVGRRGSVYANIPARNEGRGQVRLVVAQRSRIFNAMSDGDALPTNTEVRIVRANEDNTLTVTRA